MDKTNITTDEAAACLKLLVAADGPMTAIAIAAKLNMGGTRETQRRHVRAIIKHLRDTGAWIVGTLQEGYFLTADANVWRDYNEGRQIDAKKIFGETHRRVKSVLADRLGQGLLFNPNPRVCV